MIGVLVLAVSGIAGFWPWIGAPLVGAILLLPGYALSTAFDDGDTDGRPGRLALAFSLSVAVYSTSAMAATLTGLSWPAAGRLFATVLLCLAAAVWRAESAGRRPREPFCYGWLALLLALAALLPAVSEYAGGGVDDWWDLAYVRALSDRPSIDFSEPMFGSGRIHPRFSWSAWLLIQASARRWAGVDIVRLQSEWLAPLVCVASLSAVYLLARAVFGTGRRAPVVLSVLAAPAWLYATDALPYFTRLHQDKFVAALVLMPVLVATALDYIARPSRQRGIIFALSAMALCSVHTLIFGIGSLGVFSCVLIAFAANRDRRGWYTVRRGAFRIRHAAVLMAVLALTSVPPLWQAWALRGWFADQGVHLATPDNPVVRAHLALDRLVAPGEPYMVVSPAALFGPVGVIVALGACLALRRKRVGDGYLLALTLVPSAILFAPLVAAGVGMLTVPWMLYRVGWLIPQPLLLARVFTAAMAAERAAARWLAVAVCGLVVVALTLPTAGDRLRRGMREHPISDERFPRGATLAAYRFLDSAERQGAVIAPMGFSNLVPAMTGRNVVAFSERGTLVFAGSEPGAYERLRDRATFFSCATAAATRKQIADHYGVAYAVFRRRYRTTGDELAWLDRATADGVLLATDASLPIGCTISEEHLISLLPVGWRIAFANPDYFIVETAFGGGPVDSTEPAPGRWLEVVGAEPDDPRGEEEMLASATGYPGALVSLQPVPAGLGIGNELLWSSGGALWDDGPTEISVEVKLPTACPVTAVEIVPYLETRRREVLELRVEGRVRAMHARDGIPRRMALQRSARDVVRVDVRSKLGLPFGIADVRLFGDRSECEGGWRPLSRPEIAGRPIPLASYFALASEYPRAPRAALDLAARLGAVTSTDDAIATLRRGLSRQPGRAASWIELGLRLDAVGRFEEALGAYRRARAVDSNSAWANGCLAWASVRAGRPMSALWYAWRAERLDPRYADAVTIAGLAWERLGSTEMSASALERAIKMAPKRAWPYIERARQLAAAGKREEARTLLRRYRELVPDDPLVIESLRTLAAGDLTGGR